MVDGSVARVVADSGCTICKGECSTGWVWWCWSMEEEVLRRINRRMDEVGLDISAVGDAGVGERVGDCIGESVSDKREG